MYKNILLKSPTARLVLKELKGELGKIIMARLKKTMPEVLDRIIMMPVRSLSFLSVCPQLTLRG